MHTFYTNESLCNYETKNSGNTNFLSFTTGSLRKKRPITIKPTPKYLRGSSNRSPKKTIAANDSTNAFIPSHAEFTSNICEPCSDFIKKYTTPIYPTVPTANGFIPPLFANSL